MTAAPAPRRLRLTAFRLGFLFSFLGPLLVLAAAKSMSMDDAHFNVEVVSHGADVSRQGGARVAVFNEQGLVAEQLCRGGCDDVQLRMRSGDNAYWVEVFDAAGRKLAGGEGMYVTNGPWIVRWTVAGDPQLRAQPTLLSREYGGRIRKRPMTQAPAEPAAPRLLADPSPAPPGLAPATAGSTRAGPTPLNPGRRRPEPAAPEQALPSASGDAARPLPSTRISRMPNSLLTATAVTREALRVLHQKLNFVGSITREYDDSFARQGAKVGDTLKVRLPNQYTVRTGATLAAQDTSESSVDLKVQTQKGVDLNFTSVDLTMSLDDFSERVVEPAMSVLAAHIEADAMSMYRDVYNQVTNAGQPASFAKVLQGRKVLVDNLAPLAGRTCNLNTQDNVDLVDALKGLFNDKAAISKQYREGFMGRTAGFDFMENTLWPSHTRGTANSGYIVNGASQTGASLVVSTGTGTINRGDVFTIAGVFRVHPETKATTGQLQPFTVTADHAGGAGTLAITPAIVTSGAGQNVTGSPANGAAIAWATTAASHGVSLAYQKGAFAFATADMVMPRGVDFAARENFDGISMRIVRQYDINSDKFPCRLDVLYGYKTLRPQLACRLANN